MSVTDLFLVRHGETEFNRIDRIQGRSIDKPLNKRGVMQSRALSRFFNNSELDLVACSSLRRSKQTAEIITEQKEVELLPFEELDEMDFGIIEGRKISEIKEELDILHNRWQTGDTDYALRKGESPREVLERAGNRAEEILKDNIGKSILFVLHGRLIRILIANWIGYGLQRMREVKHTNASVNHLQWDGSSFWPVYLNKTDHLESITTDELDL